VAGDSRSSDKRREEVSDTIFAVSSGAPPAAIAVMRISGPSADAALKALGVVALPEPRHAGLRKLSVDGAALDDALVLRFPGPNSATGEDLVELHLHGGRATIAAVGAVLAAISGLRPAEPGEFTRQAFLNGRMDLAQAEGLADLLAAETEHQRRSALAMASGGLSAQVEVLRGELLAGSARVEAAIDFADEDDVSPWPERTMVLSGVAAEIDALLAQPPAERLRDGVRVAIAGPPNAGKSTLINRLVSREAAITSPIAGTTRDVIEVPVQLRGLPLVFIDTAGLRGETDDSIEAIGIARAEAIVAAADLVLWLGEAAETPKREGVITIRAKIDIGGGAVDDPRLAVSALSGVGMPALIDAIVEAAKAVLPPPDAIALNARQRACLFEVATECTAAADTDDLILAAEHLRHARLSLDRLTGRTGVEDMLDALFGTFCIGK
jgi:tRNA modification GTPase